MFTKFTNPLHHLFFNLKSIRPEKNGIREKIIFCSALLATCLLFFVVISVYHQPHRGNPNRKVYKNKVISNPIYIDKAFPASLIASYKADGKRIISGNNADQNQTMAGKRFFNSFNATNGDSGEGRISGLVRDENLKGIASADILLYMDNHWLAATFTSANGEFNFNHIMPGCYQLKISRVGYYDEVHNNFEVTAGNTALLDLHMEGITDQATSGYSPVQGQSLTSLSRNRTMMKTGKRDSRALSSYVSGVTKSSQKLSGRGSRMETSTYQMNGVSVTTRSTCTKLRNSTQASSGYSSRHLSKGKRLRLGMGNRFRKLTGYKKHKKIKSIPLPNPVVDNTPAPVNNPVVIPAPAPFYNTESYAPLVENEYMNPFNDPLSTFSIDVDNASFTNTRRMIQAGQLPPKDAVRIEEFINYFDYKYPQPKDGKPFSINLETASCPWNKETRLVHIGLKGKIMENKNRPVSNLVFLVDVSGSMQVENKLPLVKESLKLLVNKMQKRDRIAIVAYAGAAGLVLGSTECSEKGNIMDAIDELNAGGSTAGGEGIILAYKVAKENLIKGGNNRIILVTDGDFNIGVSSDGEMKSLIEEKRRDGIFLTVCGFGMGNYKDSKLETLADYGNGNYYYIDNFQESEKVFSKGLAGTLFTIAKDVKIQVEFNPKFVKAYRLIGYENRLMEAQDFANDAKDAGELGAGHTVTALYEIIPAGSNASVPGFIELKYQGVKADIRDFGNEMLTIKMRYKKTDEEVSNLLVETLAANTKTYAAASDNFRYACGVAVYGMMLRNSKFRSESSYDLAMILLKSTELNDENGYKEELLELIEQAKALSVPQ